jgi:hypothetical protein
MVAPLLVLLLLPVVALPVLPLLLVVVLGFVVPLLVVPDPPGPFGLPVPDEHACVSAKAQPAV